MHCPGPSCQHTAAARNPRRVLSSCPFAWQRASPPCMLELVESRLAVSRPPGHGLPPGPARCRCTATRILAPCALQPLACVLYSWSTFSASPQPHGRHSHTSSSSTGCSGKRRRRICRGHQPGGPPQVDNYELVVGDAVALVAFALYKQITAIVLAPNFPGWLAPVSFNPVHFVELASFAATLLTSWFIAAWLTGGYSHTAAKDLPMALERTYKAWLVALPVAASQLVVFSAAESKALVATGGFASVLPLAASGPGEPLVSAAGVLGVMGVWRCCYVNHLNAWDQQQAVREAALLTQVLAQVTFAAAVGSLVLQVAQLLLQDQVS